MRKLETTNSLEQNSLNVLINESEISDITAQFKMKYDINRNNSMLLTKPINC